MNADSIREARLRQDHSQELAEKGWYHSFELPDGTLIEGVNPLARLRERFAHFPIPADLHGKRVLDIGAWDGWFSFEAERRHADVTAIDCYEAPHFAELHKKLNSKVDYHNLEIYELPQAGLGKFDIVFLLGVLYHLRHPLLGLEIACGLTTDIAVVESFVTDGDTWRERVGEIPSMEFYEGFELGNQFDNWVGPSVGCLRAMCRAAGFARVELLRSEPYNALVACYRKWEPPPAEPACAPPDLTAIGNNVNQGINFSTRKDEYFSCWFRSAREQIVPEDLRLEVDGLGVASHWMARRQDDYWAASFRLPPGMKPGWAEVRLRFADSGFGNSLRIAIDFPLHAGPIVCRGVRDSATWISDEVKVGAEGKLSCWAEGLPENADRHNVRVFLAGERCAVGWVGAVGAGVWQINTTVPATIAKGEQALRIECAGSFSAPWTLRLV
jgi:tRNA (mo5U34)-methyltransferase